MCHHGAGQVSNRRSLLDLGVGFLNLFLKVRRTLLRSFNSLLLRSRIELGAPRSKRVCVGALENILTAQACQLRFHHLKVVQLLAHVLVQHGLRSDLRAIELLVACLHQVAQVILLFLNLGFQVINDGFLFLKAELLVCSQLHAVFAFWLGQHGLHTLVDLLQLGLFFGQRVLCFFQRLGRSLDVWVKQLCKRSIHFAQRSGHGFFHGLLVIATGFCHICFFVQQRLLFWADNG